MFFSFFSVESNRCLNRLIKWRPLAGDPGSIPGSGRSSGEGNGNPLQYSCLENPVDRGAWKAAVYGVTKVGHDLVIKPLQCANNPFSNAGDVRDVGLIPGLGRSRGGHGNPF